MTIWLYRLLWLVLLPFVIVILLWRVLWRKESLSRLPERFGFATKPRPTASLIWIHGASVGESLSILPLVEQILITRADVHVLITTGTRTSANLIAKRLPQLPEGQRVFHQYIPFDFWPCVALFYRTWQPTLTAFVESEFWPELITTAKPVLLNARVSDRSFPRYRKYGWFFGPIIRKIPQALAQREEDARRLRALGIKQVKAAGNLKFDAMPLECDDVALCDLEEQIGDRPVLAITSTHAGEETQAAKLHAILEKDIPNLLTIIVPRHPHRGTEISRQIGAQQRTKDKDISTATSLYVADTLGEMGLWLKLAHVVVIGGSLVPHGGHNPLEPLKLGKTTFTGPYMFNFKDMLPWLTEKKVLQTVSTLEELACEVLPYLTDDDAREKQELHINQTMPHLAGATAVTSTLLLNLIDQTE